MSSADSRLHRPDPERPGHSNDLDTERESGSRVGTLRRLLDPAFGFFVWAVHFLTIYGATAVACVLGLGLSATDELQAFRLFQIGATVLALAIVLIHGWRAWRSAPTADRQFLARITAGHDLLAAVGIGWMLFPIFLEPVCR
jgi:amino acid transporter